LMVVVGKDFEYAAEVHPTPATRAAPRDSHFMIIPPKVGLEKPVLVREPPRRPQTASKAFSRQRRNL
jgi:hypothetical protein